MAGGTIQKNKKHKSRFSSKSQRNKHKTSKESFGERNVKSSNQSNTLTLGRTQRIQRTKMIRDKKRSEILEKKRSQVGHGGVPCIVVLVGLHRDVNLRKIRNQLLIECRKEQYEHLNLNSNLEGGKGKGKEVKDVDMVENEDKKEILNYEHFNDDEFVKGLMNEITVSVPKYKLRITIMEVDREKDIMTNLEFIKVADILAMVVPAPSDAKASDTSLIDEWGKKFLSLARAQGMPAVIGVAEDILHLSVKSRAEAKKKSFSILETELPEKSKLFSTDTSEDYQIILRYFSNFHQTSPVWRSQRPYIIAHNIEFSPSNEDLENGKLFFSGYLRGRGLSVNQLVHVAGIGDFQLSQIDGPDDPCPLKVKFKKNNDVAMKEADSASAVLAKANPEIRESIVIENMPDPLAGEQTWPTEEEMFEAKEKRKMKKKMVPKGTSNYQASWYISESEEEEEDDDDDDNDEDKHDNNTNSNKENKFKNTFTIQENAKNKKKKDDEDEDEVANAMDEDDDKGNDGDNDDDDESEWEEVYENNERHHLPSLMNKFETSSSRAPSIFDDGEDESMMDESENMNEEQREEERKRILAEHEDDEKFPDEVDTPTDVFAKKRFQKYRGLKNFKTSFWDPKETLPYEYSKIFALENPKKIQKTALKKAADVDSGIAEGSVQTNHFIQIHVENFSKKDYEKLQSWSPFRPLVAFGLLKHETKMSVLHFSVRKNDDVAAPIKSKQELIFHVGFKSFTTKPIFSEDDMRSDKHKFEKFLHSGKFCVASIFGPLCFSPLPVLIFRSGENVAGSPEFVASGNFRGTNPDRIILKRSILSGYPHSVSKRKAVVRFMFYNPEDVRYFKPLELYTKFGRRGRIKEPIGLKGNMKCIFDNVVQQNDTVCLNLYKRVFPKWPQT